MVRVGAWSMRVILMAESLSILLPRLTMKQSGSRWRRIRPGSGRKAFRRIRFSITNPGVRSARIRVRASTRWVFAYAYIAPGGLQPGQLSCGITVGSGAYATKKLNSWGTPYVNSHEGCMRVGFCSKPCAKQRVLITVVDMQEKYP